jgi:hypothetical protein
VLTAPSGATGRRGIPYDRTITGFISLLVWFVGACVIAITIWRRRAHLIPSRGMGVRADLERLRDVPRVRVSELTITGPDVARLGLIAAPGGDRDGTNTPTDTNPGSGEVVGLEFSIAMNESDPGFPLLHEWIDRQCVLGVVMPADSRLIRLRCLEDLQPLTLRRLGPRT